MTTGGSILSFPDRGSWGNPGYRGNCSGYVYREIFEALHPRVFTDPMVGGGTSVEVARGMGIEAHGLDCKRRRENPSVKRPDRPGAPE